MNQIVAVYGSLKKGFGNHCLLENANQVSDAKVTGWDMYSFGMYPMVIPGSGTVAVELYEVTPSEMDRLDSLEGYPTFYNRKRVEAVTDSGAIEAWMYFGDKNQVERLPQVKSGVWTRKRAW
jgi:gamma-glutamylcyclotransferase (GGCT)/AIG2-like uncharacterized protein YtfP